MRAFAFLALCLIAAGCSAREQDPSPGGPAPSPTPGPTATSTPASTPAPPSSGSDSFQVVRITGEIRGQGPPYAGPVAVCGQPYFGAAIDFGGSRLEVVRDEALPAKFRLVVAHEVR
ncbi:MAG TPA: hypothetical protein VHH36_07115, partial [Candidatus Thermoplasmatota archaeon]|nr:hypothetical protein [Candidatus Thermoplasmatota archaeon]